jgi:hypothetical protein
MITFIIIGYGVILLTVVAWTLNMLHSNRHFRTVLHHPSMTVRHLPR